MMTPLWQPGNQTMDSAVFRVIGGQGIVLFATGFKRHKHRVSANDAQVPQMACVNRLLFEASETRPLRTCGCDYVFDLAGIRLETIVDEPIISGTCGWSLSACDNMRILAIPGYYRLHLNDSTAIGEAQVYAESYSLKSLPLNSKLFFSQE